MQTAHAPCCTKIRSSNYCLPRVPFCFRCAFVQTASFLLIALRRHSLFFCAPLTKPFIIHTSSNNTTHGLHGFVGSDQTLFAGTRFWRTLRSRAPARSSGRSGALFELHGRPLDVGFRWHIQPECAACFSAKNTPYTCAHGIFCRFAQFCAACPQISSAQRRSFPDLPSTWYAGTRNRSQRPALSRALGSHILSILRT